MKRIRVATGRFVTISTELAEKAARVFGKGLTREQVLAIATTEPKHIAGPMAGSLKPLAICKPKGAAKTARSRGARQKTRASARGRGGVG